MPYSIKGPPASHGPPVGRLWRYDPDGSLHEMDSGITLSNGMGWSPDSKTSLLPPLHLVFWVAGTDDENFCSVFQRFSRSNDICV